MLKDRQPQDPAFDGQSFETLFWLGDHIPGGFFIYRADDTQELLYVNRSVLDIFGCEDEAQFRALTGYSFRGMVHPEDHDRIQASILTQIEDKKNRKHDYVEYRILRRDGAVRWVDDYGYFAQLPGFGKVYYVFISDVTEKRMAEQEKALAMMELAREKQLGEMRSAFLFNVSHDIRTPMNAVIGYTQLARRHSDDPALMNSYLDRAIASGGQMLQLIDDLLEMNTLEKSRVTLSESRADLREQLELALSLHRLDAESRGIVLRERIELPDTDVMVDQSRFRRVISNLLSNAVKFTPAGGTVTLSADLLCTGESGFARYRFQVADTGIGIGSAFLPRIYGAFEREDSSTKTGISGTGLGLSIVKRLLDLMGGSIDCESEKGKGTVFTVELPLKLAGGAPPAPAVQVSAYAESANGRRILVVEDIAINRALVEDVLTEYGFLVESAADGCDAVEAVKAHEPGYYDLVLMDIQMPVMNGYEATRAIRALPREDAAALPILALSANARDEDRRLSLESGMNDHMAKPFDIDRLIQAIEYYTTAGHA